MSLHREGGSHVVGVTTWTIVKVILVLLGFGLLWYMRDIVAMLFVALLLAALIDPFADWFESRHIPRGLAVVIIYLVLALVIGLVFFLFIPPLAQQATQLIQTLGYAGQFDSFLRDIGGFASGSTVIDSGQIVATIQQFSQTVTGLVGGIGATVIVLVLTFYMVVEEQAVSRVFRMLAPMEYQPYLVQLFDRMRTKIGQWLRGQIILGLIIGVLVYIGLTIVGVRYALVLALIAGVLEIIPYVGPILASLPAIVLSFLESPIKGGLVLLVYVLIQQMENNLLVPRVMQKVTGLNPIISISALLVGLKLGGIVGAIFAIPVATLASVVLEDLFYDSDASS